MFRLLIFAISILAAANESSFAQTGSSQSKKQPASKVPTIGEAEIYHEAYLLVRKAQDMIGTPKENSDEQAELFQKAIRIKPDFLEAHYNLGLIFANQKKWQQAIGKIKRVRCILQHPESLSDEKIPAIWRPIG